MYHHDHIVYSKCLQKCLLTSQLFTLLFSSYTTRMALDVLDLLIEKQRNSLEQSMCLNISDHVYVLTKPLLIFWRKYNNDNIRPIHHEMQVWRVIKVILYQFTTGMLISLKYKKGWLLKFCYKKKTTNRDICVLESKKVFQSLIYNIIESMRSTNNKMY